MLKTSLAELSFDTAENKTDWFALSEEDYIYIFWKLNVFFDQLPILMNDISANLGKGAGGSRVLAGVDLLRHYRKSRRACRSSVLLRKCPRMRRCWLFPVYIRALCLSRPSGRFGGCASVRHHLVSEWRLRNSRAQHRWGRLRISRSVIGSILLFISQYRAVGADATEHFSNMDFLALCIPHVLEGREYF